MWNITSSNYVNLPRVINEIAPLTGVGTEANKMPSLPNTPVTSSITPDICTTRLLVTCNQQQNKCKRYKYNIVSKDKL